LCARFSGELLLEKKAPTCAEIAAAQGILAWAAYLDGGCVKIQ